MSELKEELAGDLPPLPEPACRVIYNESKGYEFDVFTADRMRAYARAALTATMKPAEPEGVTTP